MLVTTFTTGLEIYGRKCVISATGSKTFASKKKITGANLLLKCLAHFHNKYIFCSLLDQIYS